MSRAGFDVPLDARPIPSKAILATLDRLDATFFELADRATIATVGYAADRSSSTGVGADPSADRLTIWINALPESRRATFQTADLGTDEARLTIDDGNGATLTIPGNGCLFDATEALWGSALKYNTLSQQTNMLVTDIVSIVQSDSGLVKAKMAWRNCMHNAGYEAADLDTFPSTSEQRSDNVLALVDWDCRRFAQIVEARGQALINAGNQMADRIQILSTTVQEFVTSADGRSAQLVQDGG